MEAYWVVAMAGVFVVYALFSNRLQTTAVTGPMVFVTVGLVLGGEALGVVDPGLRPEFVTLLLEVTLAVVLFSDATTISGSNWRREASIPGRLLIIGLPLTIAAGFAAAVLLFTDLDLWEAALVGAVLAPTDASLGQAAISNVRVPQRIRQALNVESGLNDGIVLPVILVLLRFAEEAEGTGSVGAVIGLLSKEILVAAVVGLVLGVVVAWAMRRASRNGWMSPMWTRIGALALAFAAYGLAIPLGGSGFIAAWVAGLTLARATRGELESLAEFGEELGAVLVALSFFVFGAFFLGPALGDLTWEIVVYAVVSLTVVRAIPVALASVGSGLRSPSVAYLAWFGPRGLASVIFAGVVVEEAGLEGTMLIVNVVMVTVALSVLAHGITAWLGSERYADWYQTHAAEEEGPSAEAVAGPSTPVPSRHSYPFIRPNKTS